MKYLILSDIHGNLEALQSVLNELKSEDIEFDECITLGDLVGYGANPNEVIDKIKELKPKAAIRGNHDRAASGLEDAYDFNRAAQKAILWTRSQLSSESRDYLVKLRQGPVEVGELFDIVHGAPWDEDYYIFDWQEALTAFQRSERNLILFGHTHVPFIWTFNDAEIDGELIPDGQNERSLGEGKRYLINPGSVGQPRDRNPKASMAIFDTDEMNMQFRRVEYDIKSAQQKIRQAGVDSFLADRLAEGI